MGRAGTDARATRRGLPPAASRDEPEWLVFDVETTGLRPTDRVVEFACEAVSISGEVVDRYETLIDPGRSPGPSRIHHITMAMLQAAPVFRDVAGDIQRCFRDRIPVAHHLSFDWTILRAEFARVGVDLPFPVRGVCTAELAKLAGGGSARLVDACKRHGIGLAAPHEAASDVRATTQLLHALKSSVSRLSTLRVCDPFQGAWQLPCSVTAYPRRLAMAAESRS